MVQNISSKPWDRLFWCRRSYRWGQKAWCGAGRKGRAVGGMDSIDHVMSDDGCLDACGGLRIARGLRMSMKSMKQRSEEGERERWARCDGWWYRTAEDAEWRNETKGRMKRQYRGIVQLPAKAKWQTGNERGKLQKCMNSQNSRVNEKSHHETVPRTATKRITSVERA